MWSHTIHPLQCCDIWAAGQYLTLPAYSHLSYFSVQRTAYCNTTAYVVVVKNVALQSPTHGNTKFITTIQFPQRDLSLHIFFYLKHHRAICRVILLLLMSFTRGHEFVHWKRTSLCLQETSISYSSQLIPRNWTSCLSGSTAEYDVIPEKGDAA